MSITPLPVVRRAYLKPLGLVRVARNTLTLAGHLLRTRPEVVWCATSAVLLAAPVARMCGVRKIVLHQQEIWMGVEGHVLRALARSCTNIVAISDAVANSGPQTIATAIIPNGTDEPGDVSPVPGSGRPRFLMASRWNSWKGHRTLLEAWKRAGEPGELLIAGGPPPVGAVVDVPKIVREMGLGASVTVVGETGSIGSLIQSVHYTVVPSDSPEPFGLVAIESMAYGRPVVASDGGGLGDIVTNGLDGFVFHNTRVDELATVLRQCTVEKSVHMAVAARRTYRNRYSLEAFQEKVRNFWRFDVLGEPEISTYGMQGRADRTTTSR